MEHHAPRSATSHDTLFWPIPLAGSAPDSRAVCFPCQSTDALKRCTSAGQGVGGNATVANMIILLAATSKAMKRAIQGSSGAAATNVEYGNSGTRVHAMLPFSGRVHSFKMDVERRGRGFTDGRPSYSAAARSQSTACAGVEHCCASGSVVYRQHSHLVSCARGDGDAGIVHTALHACTSVVAPYLLKGPAHAYSAL